MGAPWDSTIPSAWPRKCRKRVAPKPPHCGFVCLFLMLLCIDLFRADEGGGEQALLGESRLSVGLQVVHRHEHFGRTPIFYFG